MTESRINHCQLLFGLITGCPTIDTIRPGSKVTTFCLHRQSAYACPDSAPDYNMSFQHVQIPRDYHGNHALCLKAFCYWLLVTVGLQLKMWIQTFQTSLAWCRSNHRRNGPSMKIVPNKIAKELFTQIFLRNFWLWDICQNIFDTSWDFKRDKFSGKWFFKNLALRCQRH
jgi:hypothetical protein